MVASEPASHVSRNLPFTLSPPLPPLQPAMLRLSGVPEPPLTALPTRQGSWALPCSPRVLKHILPSHTLFQAPELAALLLEFFCHMCDFCGEKRPHNQRTGGQEAGGGRGRRSGPRSASSGPRTRVQPVKRPLSPSERGCGREALLCFPCLVTVGSLCPFPSLASSPLPVLRAPFPTASHTFLSKVARIGNSCLLPRSLTCPLTVKVTQIGASQKQAFKAATFHCSGPSPWSPQ